MTPALFISSFSMDEKEAEARPVMGTIFLVYIYMLSVCLVCQSRRSYVDQTRACSKSFFLAVKPVTPVLFISYTLEL